MPSKLYLSAALVLLTWPALAQTRTFSDEDKIKIAVKIQEAGMNCAQVKEAFEIEEGLQGKVFKVQCFHYKPEVEQKLIYRYTTNGIRYSIEPWR